MQISISKPDFSVDFKDHIARARAKGCTQQIIIADTFIEAQVIASGRLVGKFSFDKEDDNCILKGYHVIEREFYPFEFIIFELAKFLKRKKIKFIVWN
jgi:hypothetical protein